MLGRRDAAAAVKARAAFASSRPRRRVALVGASGGVGLSHGDSFVPNDMRLAFGLPTHRGSPAETIFQRPSMSTDVRCGCHSAVDVRGDARAGVKMGVAAARRRRTNLVCEAVTQLDAGSAI
jgi:hypothetical protein